MRAFVSYSHNDKAFARELVERLRSLGVEVFSDEASITPGSSWATVLREALLKADIFLVVLSPSSTHSEYVQSEVANALFAEKPVIPLIIADCTVPSTLADRVWIDFRTSTSEAWRELEEAVHHWSTEPERVDEPRRAEPWLPNEGERAARWQEELSDAFRNGDLTLVCGAGVSASAGMPDWDGLLDSMLEETMIGEGSGLTPGSDEAARAVELFRRHFQSSPLILARHLKNTFRDDFLDRVRSDLYRDHRGSTTSPLIDAVVGLCRPRRRGEALKAIVTFNFDDLIERALRAERIAHHPIHAEGQRCPPDELPIYHVHGYLPSHGDVPEDHGVVLSEDAYHTQFVDSFNWSNLVQLIELTQSTCLLVGLSVTDPNVRRLLDVAARKGADRPSPHHLIRRRPGAAGIPGTDDDELRLLNVLNPRVEVLEELDANGLGLNVIWVDDYDEIPGVLQRIGE